MTKQHDLPTFPIYEGMELGYERDDEELYWLLEHGSFKSSNIAFYQRIALQDGEYVLLSGSNERHLAHHGEEELGRFQTLKALLASKKLQKLSLARWQWHGNE